MSATDRGLAGSFRPSVRDDVLQQDLDGDLVVFDTTTRQLVTFNRSAGTLWSCCDGYSTVDEISADVAAIFAVPREVVRTQLLDLLAEWSRLGLLSTPFPEIDHPDDDVEVPQGAQSS